MKIKQKLRHNENPFDKGETKSKNITTSASPGVYTKGYIECTQKAGVRLGAYVYV